jgi:aspartate/methionine/tyrosine aminotransferase
MSNLERKFAKLGVETAPGQETRQALAEIDFQGEQLSGTPVDFSHGDVDAFPPIPGSREAFVRGFDEGAEQAYTEYRGRQSIRADLGRKLAEFTGAAIDVDHELILTPGTQGALFLAMGACVGRGDKVAIVEPDYFANRKLVEFFEGELVPIQMNYLSVDAGAGLNIEQLADAFRQGVKLFVFSNPNNPTGVIYSQLEIEAIAKLAQQYGVTVIADELYSRQIFDMRHYTHIRALHDADSHQLITIIGPSKTESLSGFRLGVAIGAPKIIERMEKLQAIVSLRAAGYCQAALHTWFAEPENWMAERIAQHQAIRDGLMAQLQVAEGFDVRVPEGGSYLFPGLPPISLDIVTFSKVLRLQAGVSVTPGIEFGPQFTRHFRVNFSQDRTAAIDAMRRIVRIVDSYRT